jgi:hypothetical protein
MMLVGDQSALVKGVWGDLSALIGGQRERGDISGVRLLKTSQPEPDGAALIAVSVPRSERWKVWVAVSCPTVLRKARKLSLRVAKDTELLSGFLRERRSW